MKILSISVLPLGWGNQLNMGMPSVQLAQVGYVKRGHTIEYITLGDKVGNDSLYDGNIRITYIKEPRKPISRRIVYSISQRFYSMEIWKRLYRAGNRYIKKERPDLIIGNTFYGAVPAYRLAKKHKIPYMFREYGTMGLADIVTSGNCIRRLGKWCEIKAYKLPAQAYIFTDDGSRTDVAAKALKVDMTKVHFLKNGIFNADDITSFDYPEGEFSIVTAGRLSAFKHMDDIVRAFYI